MKESSENLNKLPVTESPSNFDNLEGMSVRELLTSINLEDSSVPAAVGRAIPQIEFLIETIVAKMKKGGRIFYLGAGTSGRLGVLDASEVPPTFGVPPTMVIGLIAGGDTALRKAVEAAEESVEELTAAGQDYEAQILKGVEDATDHRGKPVPNHGG